jgi:hypothetical protein
MNRSSCGADVDGKKKKSDREAKQKRRLGKWYFIPAGGV